MLINKNFFLLSSLSTSILISTLLTISCSHKSNNTLESNPPIEKPAEPPTIINPDLDINDNYNIEINWLQGFRDQKTSFLNKDPNFLFEIDETILNDLNFNIQYIGDNKKIPCYSIYDKKIKKYYLASGKLNYQYLFQNSSYAKIKKFLSDKLIKNYQEKMIIKHYISDENFFIPIDPSDKSLFFIKNKMISFKSSWGVGNSAREYPTFNIKMSSNKIREMLFGPFEQNYRNFFIEDVEATDLHILPKMIILDSPVNYFDFNIDTIKNNFDDKFLSLTKDETTRINIDIPGKNGIKSQNWIGTVCGMNLSGTIASTKYLNGISSLITTMIDTNNFNYDNVLDRINNSNKQSVKEYVDEIVKKGKKIKIGIKNKFSNNNELISYDVNTTIKAGANAANLFGDRTTVGLYDISAIQKMKVNFIEYKKF